MKVMVLDTESTGLIDKNVPLVYANLHKFPYIVQLSYIIIDTDAYNLDVIYDEILKMPDGVVVSDISAQIHGITNHMSQTLGTNITTVMCDLLTNSDQVDLVVCHNIEFDLTLLKVEVMRAIINDGTSEVARDLYKKALDYLLTMKNTFCTMKESIELCNIERTNSRGKYLKYPTLAELHNKLFDREPKNLHNSLNDVCITARCFFKLKNNIDIRDVNSYLNHKIAHLL